MIATVTDSYLLGIKEGRALLRSLPESPTLDELHRFAANCTDLLAMGQSREMADMYRGERDFWRNQIERSQ